MKLTAKGEPNCTAKLLPQLYSELRHPAAQRLARERPGRTLQATALIREAWLRLDHTGNHRWNGRAHFFAAAEAMRRILVDNARRKQRVRHGGDCERVEMDDLENAAPLPDDDLLALDETLNQLAELDAPAAELVKLRFFAEQTPATHAEARPRVFDYLETFYSPKRLHSALGYQSPVEFENQFN